MPFPTIFYTAARKRHLPLVPSTSLHRCKREPCAICSQHILKLLQERICFQRSPARPGTAAGENPLPLIASKALHRCRRESFAIGAQQGLASLQERTFCHWSPAQHQSVAGGEPFLQWFPARPCTAAGEKVLSSYMLSCACICACVYPYMFGRWVADWWG